MRKFALLLIIIASTSVTASDEAHSRLQNELAILDWQQAKSSPTLSGATQLYLESALRAASTDPDYYLARARSLFEAERYRDSVSSLDIYIELQGNSVVSLLLRGLAKKSMPEPDLAGACADFMTLNTYGFDVSVIEGIEQDCRGHDGW
jgi:hypothetical protein